MFSLIPKPFTNYLSWHAEIISIVLYKGGWSDSLAIPSSISLDSISLAFHLIVLTVSVVLVYVILSKLILI